MAEISMQDLMPLLLSAATAGAQSALRIGLILLAGSLGVRFLRAGLQRLEALLIRTGEVTETDSEAARKRVTTLVSLLRTLATVVIWAVVGVVVLAQLGLDVTPILAGAGIVGLAVGFGAQNLVRDLISGFFLVLENQVRVGDVAIVNGTGGLVEALTFRTIVLRDLAGVVHVFPNGTVDTLSNMTMGWSAYVIDVGVAYKEDTDRVVAVLKGVAEELQKDPAYGPLILEPLEVFGVDDFRESEVTIKVRLKTQPIQQWTVGREYRRRIKQAFDAEGIEIPFPHRTLYMGEASKPFPVLLADGSARAGATG
ncbi:MAG TPA: mechanosensitive ion channel family protein [Candidatus Methylomirabilis sp.]|jgi:small conductance mechanosensitive channel|nr:mechanosensitive ion channel family protein [Candidatus Methylomirabilis sp.]